MNGGGRLARSPRSPRQQTDLTDALAGVAAALRARLPFAASPAKTRRRNDQPSGLIAFVENRLPRRTGLAATLMLLIASTGLGVVKGGHLEVFLATLSEARNAIANSAGFRITSVAINGRKQLTQD
jgi:cell division protein FtsQ